MAYKSKRRQLAYMRQWRAKHRDYMRDYYQNKVKPRTERMAARIRKKLGMAPRIQKIPVAPVPVLEEVEI